MVLLVVDVQAGYMVDALYSYEAMHDNIMKLIAQARNSGVEVVYVRHDCGPGTGYSVGDDTFEIAADFAPAEGEMIFDKTVNTAFLARCGAETLAEYMRSKAERQVMVVGLQTEYCIDATIKSGFEHGFEMIVPEGTNSTFDNRFLSGGESYRYYNEFIWPNRYARCVGMDEALALLKAEGGTNGV